MSGFKVLNPEDFGLNPLTDIAGRWWLVGAGREGYYNVMTASWGHLGSLWGRKADTEHRWGLPSATIFIRPQRYTREFLDREDFFTLSILTPEYHRDLGYLGSHSGREGDKLSHTGLTPYFEDGMVGVQEAEYILKCRKLYAAPLNPDGFCDQEIKAWAYPDADFHILYVGEVVQLLGRVE